MPVLKPPPAFTQWVDRLEERLLRARLTKRLLRLEAGNCGDAKPAGESVVELREHFGPGRPMYGAPRGKMPVLLLGGGDKATQRADVQAANRLARAFEASAPPRPTPCCA